MRGSAALAVLSLAFAACGGAGRPVVADVEPVFGTEAPGLVEAYDLAGTWVILCQAREDTDGDGQIEVWSSVSLRCRSGDALHEWLVIGGGEGTDVGLLLAVDPRSRWVVGWRPDRPVLYDTRTKTATPLAPQPAVTAHPEWEDAFATFDATGTRLVYGRSHAGASSPLRVRDLATGFESEIDPGPGTVIRPRFSPDGRFLNFTVVPRDSDGNGVIEAPDSPAAVHDGGCSANVSCVTWKGDDGHRRIIELGGTRRFDVEDFVGFCDEGWIVLPKGGTERIEGPDGHVGPCSIESLFRAYERDSDRRCDLDPFPFYGEVTPAHSAHAAGALVAQEGLVRDARGTCVGTYPAEAHWRFPQCSFPTEAPAVMGLRADGALLRPDHASRYRSALPLGPFRWRKPDPPK